MAIPVVYIWSGYFPAALPESVLIVLIAYAVMSSVIKYYVRPGRNVLHDVRYALVTWLSSWRVECLLAN